MKVTASVRYLFAAWMAAFPSLVVLAATDQATVTFMHYNDLHAHLTPHLDLAPAPRGNTKVVERGGLARLATLVKQIRSENPNSVLMNVGDTFHGGVEALYTSGNAIVGPVNALGVDVGVPGNWDFAFGPTTFRARYTDATRRDLRFIVDPLRPNVENIERPNFPNLAANMTEQRTGDYLLPPTLTMDVGGVNVGFIGLTSDIVPFMYALLAPGLDFVQGEENYRILINTLAADLRAGGCAVVVVMSELGLHKDRRLAEVIDPGAVDVFFSAHTHEATIVPLQSASGALVVEAGNDGFLGRMDITLTDGVVTETRWLLLPIDDSIAEDPEMLALVEAARAQFLAEDVNIGDPQPNSTLALTEPIDTVIGQTSHALDRRHALENSFNNAFTDIGRYFSGTQLAMTPGFRFDSVVPAAGTLLEDNTVALGDITLEDVYRFFPVGFTIATGEVSGQRLREIMEDNLTHVYSTQVFNHGGGWFDGFSGLSMTLDLAAPDGARIVDLRLKETGAVIADTDVITVTGCRRPVEQTDALCNYEGFSNVNPLIRPGTADPWTAIDLLIEAISQGVPYDAARRDIVDLSETPVWPNDSFVQPLVGVQ